MNDRDGYRPTPASGGARVRADIVEVYVARRAPGMLRREHRLQMLQLRRADEPLRGTWHPVMGHAESGETALDAAERELTEEVGLRLGSAVLLGLYALEQVRPFFVSAVDAVVCSPRLVAEVTPAWAPTLGPEHDAARWIPIGAAHAAFMWPGQVRACAEIEALLLNADHPARSALRLR